MKTEFEVRQQVKTVRRNWLETVSRTTSERIARADYSRLIKEHPEEYFELVRLVVSEECLEFTPKYIAA